MQYIITVYINILSYSLVHIFLSVSLSISPPVPLSPTLSPSLPLSPTPFPSLPLSLTLSPSFPLFPPFSLSLPSLPLSHLSISPSLRLYCSFIFATFPSLPFPLSVPLLSIYMLFHFLVISCTF